MRMAAQRLGSRKKTGSARESAVVAVGCSDDTQLLEIKRQPGGGGERESMALGRVNV